MRRRRGRANSMGIPDRIKFGFTDLRIREESDLVARSGGAIGSARPDIGLIAIQSSLSDRAKVEVLFGSLHYAVGQISIPAYEKIDRERISRIMYGVLRDNADLTMLRETSKLRIIGSIWRIERESEHFRYAAYKEGCNHVLKVNSSRRGTPWFQSLFHEIYHVVFDILQLTPDDPDEIENDVDSLAWHLVLLLSQNDFSWLLED